MKKTINFVSMNWHRFWNQDKRRNVWDNYSSENAHFISTTRKSSTIMIYSKKTSASLPGQLLFFVKKTDSLDGATDFTRNTDGRTKAQWWDPLNDDDNAQWLTRATTDQLHTTNRSSNDQCFNLVLNRQLRPQVQRSSVKRLPESYQFVSKV